MGADSFSVLATGETAEKAFADAVAEARYQYGNRGYSGSLAEKSGFVYHTREVLTERDAETTARAVLGKEHDKWDPASCIPVRLPYRDLTLTGLAGTLGDEGTRAAVDARLAETKALAKGETVKSVRYTSYQTPSPGPVGYGYGARPPAPTKFTDGIATVRVNRADAPTTRTVTTTVTVVGDPDHAAVGDAIAGKVKVGPREKVTAVERETAAAPARRTYRTTTSTEGGRPVTRYVVAGSRAHGTWRTGFPTQAAARAHAVEAASAAPGLFGSHDAEFCVDAVTRREDGSPLVRVHRTLVRTVYTATVTVTRDNTAPGPRTADAWLFFGLASS